MLENILTSLGFDLRYFAFSLLNYILISFLLYKFVIKKLVVSLSERQRIIDEGIENKTKYEELIKKAQHDYEKIILDAKAHANGFISEKKKEAYRLADSIVSEGKKQVEEMLRKTKLELEREREEFLKYVKKEAVKIVVEAAKKLKIKE